MTLDQYIEIKRKAQVQQPDGSLQTTLSVLSAEYAKVVPMRGSERNASSQTESPANYRFHIHQRTDIREDDVIVWNGDSYNIRFISSEGQGAIYLMIEAERGVAV